MGLFKMTINISSNHRFRPEVATMGRRGNRYSRINIFGQSEVLFANFLFYFHFFSIKRSPGGIGWSYQSQQDVQYLQYTVLIAQNHDALIEPPNQLVFQITNLLNAQENGKSMQAGLASCTVHTINANDM